MRNVLTALEVLEGVARLQPVGLSALARALGIPKTTVQRCLVTLAEAGWVHIVPDRDGTKWEVASKPFIVAVSAAGRMDLPDVGMRRLQALARESRCGATLSIRDGDEIVTVGHVGREGFSATGSREPLHAGVDGEVIMAFAPPGELGRYLRRHDGAAHLGAGQDDLRRRHDLIRRRGFAVSGDLEVASTTIAAAIRLGLGWPVGSISVTVPEAVLAAGIRDQLGAMVARAATGIAEDLAIRAAGV
ncbi:IclR family transcriptional regulator [Mycolicibacterium sp. CBM1]